MNRKAYQADYYLKNKPTPEDRALWTEANRDKKKIWNAKARAKAKLKKAAI